MLNSLRLWNIILLINTQRDNADEHWAWAEATQGRFWFHNLTPNFAEFCPFCPFFAWSRTLFRFSLDYEYLPKSSGVLSPTRFLYPCQAGTPLLLPVAILYCLFLQDIFMIENTWAPAIRMSQIQEAPNITTSQQPTAVTWHSAWKLWTTPQLHHFLHYRLKNEQKIIPSTIQPQRHPWEERLTW